MTININHATNDISASGSGSVTIDGATPGGGGGADLFAESYDGTSTKPVATGTNSVAIGRASATGSNSFSAVTWDTTSTYGSQGFGSVSMGYQAKSQGNYGLALGSFCIQSGSSNAVSIGRGSEATEKYSFALGAYAKSDIIGKLAYTGNKITSTTGSSQQGTFVLMKQTTDATQIALTTEGSGTGTARNRMFIGANTAYAFTGMVVAKETGSTGDLAAAWQVQGLVKTGWHGGPTLVTKVINVIDNTPSWGFDITTFNVNTGVAGIDFLATGQASKNISWVATITTTELINP